MFRSANLSPTHFASKWEIPTKEDFHNYEDTNILGIKYANLPDGADKEALMEEIIKCWHGYISKYVNMIVRGHLPATNSGAGMEAIKFLRLLSSGGDSSNRMYGEVCRTLHLAFKQSTTDDIYDSLLMCLMRAVEKYDPRYVEKLMKVCNIIDTKCKDKPKRVGVTPEFTAKEVAARLGKDKANINSYLRKLVKRGHLKSIANSKKKIIGYRRNPESWPPPPVMFKSGPVGFTYAVQTYFRFYLHEHITKQMRSIESKEGMLQLDHRCAGDDTWERGQGTPHADGAFTDSSGQNWAADTTLMSLPLDISIMNEDWVNSTEDKLFRNLEKSERNLLYLIYVKEYSIAQIGSILGLDPKTVRVKRDEIMSYLQGHAGIVK